MRGFITSTAQKARLGMSMLREDCPNMSKKEWLVMWNLVEWKLEGTMNRESHKKHEWNFEKLVIFK